MLGPKEGEDDGLLAINVHSDGDHIHALKIDSPSSACMPRLGIEDIEAGRHFPTMQGREVFKHAVVRMPEVLTATLAQLQLTPQDLGLLVIHQANLRIAEAVAHRLGIEPTTMFNNIERYGNTTAASIPIALHEAIEAGRVTPGTLVGLTAFGAGFTWGAAVIRWGGSEPVL